MSAADGYGILNHITGVGFSVARFTEMGNARASKRGTGNSTGSTLFFICLFDVLLKFPCEESERRKKGLKHSYMLRS